MQCDERGRRLVALDRQVYTSLRILQPFPRRPEDWLGTPRSPLRAYVEVRGGHNGQDGD